ncbi:uncharacterized protein JCM10292_004019 [Rhodotorula paludigena]|uniref:uncharacterized protein n=1 Tax=Rhodotorula paludigena TaxID=86838 RepID=UPI00317B3A50
MAPSSGYPAHAGTRPPFSPSSATPSTRHHFADAAHSLKRLVQEEWDRAAHPNDAQPPPPPHLPPALRPAAPEPTHSHPGLYATITKPTQTHPRAPFPPSPPLSPEIAQPHFPPHPHPQTNNKVEEPVAAAPDAHDEEDELARAMEASLREERERRQEYTQSDVELREVLQQSQDDELARQHLVAAQEQSDLAAALAASQQQQPTSPPPERTLYRPRSQSLPSFSAAELAASAYPSEKQREHPQGRPALPPGAGSAWDDEQREMEMLALAIRISREEEDERDRIERLEMEEALRRSQSLAAAAAAASGSSGEGGELSSAPTSSSEEHHGVGNASTPTTAPTTAPTSASSLAQVADAAPATRKERRRSWLRPPLASKLSSASPPSSPPLAGAALHTAPPVPTRPPPAPPAAESARTTATYRTAPETLPFSNLAPVVQPAKPSRAPPPPPPAPQQQQQQQQQKSPRLPPTPPETPQIPSSATLAPHPFPHSQAVDSVRQEHSGSPIELPYLTPSGSLHSSNRRFSREYERLSTSSLAPGSGLGSGERSRRVSVESGPPETGSAGSTTPSSTASSESDAPLSPLEVRNPDGTDPSPSTSRQSSLETTTPASSSASGSSAYSGLAPDADVAEHEGDAVLWLDDIPVYPAGLTGVSAYAGRSMSAIDELTEPASSVINGAADAASSSSVDEAGDDGHSARAVSFPESLGSDESLARTSVAAAPAGIATMPEGDWFASTNGRDGDEGGRTLGSSDETGTVTPRADPSAAVDQLVAAAAAHVSHEDGLRFGFPSACAAHLAHACPEDGLSSAGAVPERVELSRAQHDTWAIEARSWVALVRALMWHGDTTLVASRADLEQARAGRCAATARLEFRPDDEGLPVLRLVLALVDPQLSLARLSAHKELEVVRADAEADAKGKGKARALASTAPPLLTFHLPDLLHLPTRLSSLAIQLYTLRHLAGIARATQPAQLPPPLGVGGKDEGYPAMRQLADAITALAQAAQEREREREEQAAEQQRQYHHQQQSARPPPPRPLRPAPSAPQRVGEPRATAVVGAEEQNARLVDRLRDRLRRLRRSSTASAPTPAAPAAPPLQLTHSRGSAESGSSSSGGSRTGAGSGGENRRASYHSQSVGSRSGVHHAPSSNISAGHKLVKQPPPTRTSAVPRSLRVLAQEDGPAGERDGLVRRERHRSGSVPSEMRYLPVI